MTNTATTENAAVTRDPEEVWETYTQSWKPADADTRRLSFNASLAADCIYTDPLVRAQGYDELQTYVAQFHEQVPGGHFVTEEFVAHHDVALVRWAMVDGAGQRIGDGTSCVEYDADGRLRRMTGFFQVPQS